MTVADGDWQPLAGRDPVPGDPAAVRALADGYAVQAEQLGAQSVAVRRLAGGSSAGWWTGAAAEAFRERSRLLPDDLDAVAGRFQRVARALREFAPALESAQRQARAALAVARAAQGGAGAPSLLVVGEIGRARRALDRACAERDLAAARCVRSLAAASHDRLRNISSWRRLLRTVSRVAGGMSTWFGYAAVVLCPVPGLGEVLGAVALGAGLLALATDEMLMAYGDKGAGALALDTLGVVPVGRMVRTAAVLTGGAEAARAAARVVAPRVARDLTQGIKALDEAGRALQDASRGRAYLGTWRHPVPAFLTAPGGLAHDLAMAHAVRGRRGLTVVGASYAVDMTHSAVAAGQVRHDSTAR